MCLLFENDFKMHKIVLIYICLYTMHYEKKQTKTCILLNFNSLHAKHSDTSWIILTTECYVSHRGVSVCIIVIFYVINLTL